MTPSSTLQFLLWLLIAASAISVLAKRVHIPYTVALVLGGLTLSLVHLPHLSPLEPSQRPNWLTPDIILILFLPGLVFEGGLKLNVRDLIHDAVPLLLLANVGVLLAAVVTGCLVHWATGLPLLVALLFGAIISATDPISVLAIFREMRADARLSVIVEAESLFNDGTAAALFQILLAGIVAGHLDILPGAGDFVVAVGGGAALGFFLGYAASKITQWLDDPEVEITLTTIAAYGSYLLAYRLHLSGILATAAAGLMVGNLGSRRGMSERTRAALVSFWEYLSFVMNSLIFLLIGLEVHIDALARSWRPILFAILAVVIGRAISVYLLIPASNQLAERIPARWQNVIVWGGLRGALALALALSLDPSFPDRSEVLDITYGVVIFSILIQGMTLKPLLRILGLANGPVPSPREDPA
ncbi:MAG TPA: cation:proton antiporter [Verrucomicrobiae bacterium]|nr:cation:proton antiporter [Verrucomicrobiae bacterium]